MIEFLEWLFGTHFHQWTYTYDRVSPEVTYVQRKCACGCEHEKACSPYGDLYGWTDYGELK